MFIASDCNDSEDYLKKKFRYHNNTKPSIGLSLSHLLLSLPKFQQSYQLIFSILQSCFAPNTSPLSPMSKFPQCLVCIAVFMAQINAVDLSQRPPDNSDYLERAERVYIEERLGEQSFLTQDTLHQTLVYSDNEDDDKCYYATTQCAKLCHKVPNVVWMYASCDKTCSQITMEDVMEDMSFSITHNLSWYSTKDMTELVESENVMCCTCLSRSSMTSWQRGLLALSVVVGIMALLVVVFRYILDCEQLVSIRKRMKFGKE
eukprot:TRINITY_DN3181_c1_g2_i3.p1 TRINITY_DN3181_c1_g2~~TRINITY_DN3181_c1_g2_i3.p1  ORF type:complete len:260 (-),score=7.06 TRINITY_DN3181_c1_g2_i3:111-890(-)